MDETARVTKLAYVCTPVREDGAALAASGFAGAKEALGDRLVQLERASDAKAADRLARGIVERCENRVRIVFVGQDVEIESNASALVVRDGTGLVQLSTRGLFVTQQRFAAGLDQRRERALGMSHPVLN